MQVDRDRVNSKIAFIREQMAAIENLLAVKKEQEIINDPWIMRGLKYALQTTIEAMIDICYHISAKKLQHPPLDSRDALKVLKENGIITSEEFKLYTSMVGFRNKLVHGYQQVSSEQVYSLAKNELEDFKKFLSTVLEVIKNSKS